MNRETTERTLRAIPLWVRPTLAGSVGRPRGATFRMSRALEKRLPAFARACVPLVRRKNGGLCPLPQLEAEVIRRIRITVRRVSQGGEPAWHRISDRQVRLVVRQAALFGSTSQVATQRFYGFAVRSYV